MAGERQRIPSAMRLSPLAYAGNRLPRVGAITYAEAHGRGLNLGGKLGEEKRELLNIIDF